MRLRPVSVILLIILVAMIVFAAFTLIDVYAENTWDVEYQMTNQHIEWR